MLRGIVRAFDVRDAEGAKDARGVSVRIESHEIDVTVTVDQSPRIHDAAYRLNSRIGTVGKRDAYLIAHRSEHRGNDFRGKSRDVIDRRIYRCACEVARGAAGGNLGPTGQGEIAQASGCTHSPCNA